MSETYACPYCKSLRIRRVTKETHSAWQLGLSKLGHYERGHRETFEEFKCLNCVRTFQETETGLSEENSDSEYENEETSEEEPHEENEE